MKVTYSLRAQVDAQVHKAASGEKSNHSFLTTHLVLEYTVVIFMNLIGPQQVSIAIETRLWGYQTYNKNFYVI